MRVFVEILYYVMMMNVVKNEYLLICIHGTGGHSPWRCDCATIMQCRRGVGDWQTLFVYFDFSFFVHFVERPYILCTMPHQPFCAVILFIFFDFLYGKLPKFEFVTANVYGFVFEHFCTNWCILEFLSC